MSKKVIIVESPAKTRTLSRYLGKEFKILPSMGHIIDLPAKELAVDIESDFEPKYVVIPGKQKILNSIKTAVIEADEIFLASDPDREGEAISYHIARVLGVLDKSKRVLFNEITRKAILDGIGHPGEIDINKVDAQQARRILDRLVGYKVSPLLWKILHKGLSAGRVQSVALKILTKRQEEIEAFVPNEYWTLDLILSSEKQEFPAKIIEFQGEKLEISDGDMAQKHKDSVEKSAPFTVDSVEQKKLHKNPFPPFITSTLQLEASRKLGYSAKKTMMLAQQLYEGIELGEEGSTGLITYMRTDSVRIADVAKKTAKKYIKTEFGDDYVGKIVFKTKKSAQDAHEAIRPTYIEQTPKAVKAYLSNDHFRLYELIWLRFIASQMSPARLERTTVKLKAGDYNARTSATKVVFDGFLKLWQVPITENENEEKTKLPALVKGNIVELVEILSEQHFTKPPARYSEGTLVKELESQGIGRPSTYAQIISTLIDRKYVRTEKKRLFVSELGKDVNKLLQMMFPDIFEEKFTASMEKELDEVEQGEKGWKKVLDEFYKPFSKRILEIEKKRNELKKEFVEETGRKCPECGSSLVIRWGKNGKFIACTGFPKCKYTEPIEEKEMKQQSEVTELDEKCPECGSPLVIRWGRNGKFIACTGYPKCKYTRAIDSKGKKPKSEVTELDEKCPQCGLPLVIRWGKNGKFIACTGFPKCKYTRPIEKKENGQQSEVTELEEKCPECGSSLIIRHGRYGKFIACSSYPKCKYTKQLKKYEREKEQDDKTERE